MGETWGLRADFAACRAETGAEAVGRRRVGRTRKMVISRIVGQDGVACVGEGGIGSRWATGLWLDSVF